MGKHGRSSTIATLLAHGGRYLRQAKARKVEVSVESGVDEAPEIANDVLRAPLENRLLRVLPRAVGGERQHSARETACTLAVRSSVEKGNAKRNQGRRSRKKERGEKIGGEREGKREKEKERKKERQKEEKKSKEEKTKGKRA